jgi:hypothetical protein
MIEASCDENVFQIIGLKPDLERLGRKAESIPSRTHQLALKAYKKV